MVQWCYLGMRLQLTHRSEAMPSRKVLKLNYCSNISACWDTMICNQFSMRDVWWKHLRANKNMITKTHLSAEMIFKTGLVDEDKACSRPCCQHKLLHFCSGYLCCSVSWICFHPAVEVMQKRSRIWLPALSVPDVGKWQAFLPEWFVEGASMAPVFSVHPCWGAFPHCCIAVLCVRFRVEEIRWRTVIPVLTLKSPFNRLTKMEKDCSNEDPSLCWHWTKKNRCRRSVMIMT